MSESVYKMFMVKPTEAYWCLPKEQRQELLADVRACLDKAGGKAVLYCDSSWSSEEWLLFGVEEFPNFEAVRLHSKLLGDMDWYRFLESQTLIGTATMPSE